MTDIVRLKPLEWEEPSIGLLRAESPVGRYYVDSFAAAWTFEGFNRWRPVKSVDDAKAACEAHYRHLAGFALESPWRPMGDAPRDGTRLLFALSGDDVGIAGQWCTERQLWIDSFGAVIWPQWWMPFPPVPQPPVVKQAYRVK